MRVEEGVLIIDTAVGDEMIEEFLTTLAQDGIDRVEVSCADLGASIVQALLAYSHKKEIEVHDPVLAKIFENVIFETIE